jgi:hypothetical protein
MCITLEAAALQFGLIVASLSYHLSFSLFSPFCNGVDMVSAISNCDAFDGCWSIIQAEVIGSPKEGN